MREDTKMHLVDTYNSISKKTRATCLKFYYKYNNVNVNVYFDAFDEQSVALSIVLVYGESYYYTPLNILNTGMAREYLNEIPNHILNQILVDNSLNDFYKNMEEHLLNDRPHYNYYNEDKFFVNTIKYTKNKIDRPFWKSLRRVRMTDETLYKLNSRADISLDTLRKIQEEGYTLVRTSELKERKELTLILKRIGIRLL